MNTMLDTLSKIVHAKIQAGELLLDANPIKQVSSFNELSISLKLTLLRSLIEWQLQDCHAIRAIIERGCKNRRPKEPNPIKNIDPIGYDSDKRAYYMFGDSPWLWREKSAIKTGCQWETVCRSLEELNAYADTLSQSGGRAEQLLSSIILTYVPFIEQSIREKERKEKAIERQRMAQIEAEQLGPRQLRDRRGIRPSYTFDEDIQDLSNSDEEYDQLDNGDDDDENMAERHSEPESASEPESVPKPTRFSSRLNPEAGATFVDEDVQVTTQHTDATMGEGTQPSLAKSQTTDRMDTDNPQTMSQADVIMQDAA
ncbi:hypothetical protein BCR43DRAFT_516839 [Syncephalastrum racemosum]|uniref:WHIM1 domain-containing protein n=1 Tax=Syncephalastrum racemosum TaxID=13706 RepID=A0A1X2H5T3_SYNRA|nr:hypothetical protein BCR43DRAFT_516839 [Syncephalastrum racemosum]